MRRPSVVVAAVTLLLAVGTAVASAVPHEAELGRLAAVGPVTAAPLIDAGVMPIQP